MKQLNLEEKELLTTFIKEGLQDSEMMSVVYEVPVSELKPFLLEAVKKLKEIIKNL